jgi:VIT1/CCC1 family predicted Fe2+/Mn2+ transporter
MKTKELPALGSTLVVLGIVFGSDRVIGYSFIGAGMLLSIFAAIKSRKRDNKVFSIEARENDRD